MALQPINFANIEPIVPSTGIRDVFSNILKGYKTAKEPEAMERQKLKEELLNSRLASEVEHAPEFYKNRAAQGGLGGLSGEVGQALKLHLLEQKYGVDNPIVVEAKKAYDLNRRNTESMIKARETLEQHAGERFGTPAAKRSRELAEIKAGYMPGTMNTDSPVPLTPEQQKTLIGQWNNLANKEATDTKTREKALYATNIDKTLETFDPKDLVRYAGIKGTVEKKLEQGKALTGKESENFKKYEEALSSVEVLASQVRQFYQGSVQPSEMKHLKELSNPATWKNNPDLALRKFNRVKEILNKETGTYREAISGTEVYNSPRSEQMSGILQSNKASSLSNEEIMRMIGGR